MLVFLLQDTLKKAPVGFEKKRRNIFDPEDDDESEESDDEQGSNKNPVDLPDNEEQITTSRMCPGINDKNEHDKGKNLKKEYPTCQRIGCTKKSRFDSIFCSDACGVSALEKDLLRTFFYSSDIHPSSLRH